MNGGAPLLALMMSEWVSRRVGWRSVAWLGHSNGLQQIPQVSCAAACVRKQSQHLVSCCTEQQLRIEGALFSAGNVVLQVLHVKTVVSCGLGYWKGEGLGSEARWMPWSLRKYALTINNVS